MVSTRDALALSATSAPTIVDNIGARRTVAGYCGNGVTACVRRFVLHPSDSENVPGVGKVSPGMPRYYCNTVKPMIGVAGCLRWHLLRWEDRSGADTRDIDCHQLRRREPGSSRGAVRGCPGSPERSPVHFGRRQLYTPPLAAHHGLSEPMQHQHNATLVCQIAWYELQRDCLESSENENEPLHHSW